METPDGRTLIYDAGALGGPDVTKRQIAPLPLECGIRRIDEVFLSHADLDHSTGLPALLDRFAIRPGYVHADFWPTRIHRVSNIRWPPWKQARIPCES